MFDPAAGPLLTFWLGVRRCFERRIAYLKLRLLLVLVVWEFELEMRLEGLSGYEAVDKLTHMLQLKNLVVLKEPPQVIIRSTSSISEPHALT